MFTLVTNSYSKVSSLNLSSLTEDIQYMVIYPVQRRKSREMSKQQFENIAYWNPIEGFKSTLVANDCFCYEL